MHLGLGPGPPHVVSVEGDINCSALRADPFNRGDLVCQADRQVDTTGVYADQCELVAALIALENLVCNPGQSPGDCCRVQNDTLCRLWHRSKKSPLGSPRRLILLSSVQ